MDFKNLRIKVMEDKHKMSILIFLLKNGASLKTIIYDNVSTNSRMATKIDELANAGLVDIDQRKFENNATHVSLTPLGSAIAQKAYEIELMIESGEPVPASMSTDHGAPAPHGNKVR
jgi:predicted transcriptional regulator